MKKQKPDDEQHEVTLDDVIGYTRQIKGFAKLTDEQILVLIRHFAFMHLASNQFRLQSERAAINVPPPKSVSS